ncbi:MAG TPA: hypothetical protein VEM96_14980 [Pyrinomonadaceae bacterium]|nr:hypothetical protein [Pyrinomonadaceae bacterium]
MVCGFSFFDIADMVEVSVSQEMVFLIEYNREKGRIISLKSFDDSDRVKAQDCRLELELSLNANAVEHEVVLLEAESEAAIRLTHGRYFYDLTELMAKLERGLPKPRSGEMFIAPE